LEKNRTSVIEQVHHLLGKSLDKQGDKTTTPTPFSLF
jgi:hypothetical protein